MGYSRAHGAAGLRQGQNPRLEHTPQGGRAELGGRLPAAGAGLARRSAKEIAEELEAKAASSARSHSPQPAAAGKRSRKRPRPAAAQGERPAAAPQIPEWKPRDYQQAALDAFEGRDVEPWSATVTYEGRPVKVGSNGWSSSKGPCRRMLLGWHRRAGKDRFGLELIRREADRRIGAYWHLYPLKVQAQTAIWNFVDPELRRRVLDAVFPPDWRADTAERDMFIRGKNGATYQLQGSDYYNRLVGSNTLGALFSEWALCDPNAWPYIMPILVENGGWAVFISTFRGRNHAWQMAQRLMSSPDWYVDIRSIENTHRLDGRPVVSRADVMRERESLVAMHSSTARADAQIREEFFCDPMAALPGSIYGGAMASMLREGRA